MKTGTSALVLMLTIATFGCATQYRSIDDGISGGFTETRLAPDQWRVLVAANSFTTREEAQQFLMRRAAELSLEQGKRYFELDDHHAWINVSLTPSGPVRTPADAAIVTAVDHPTRRTFDTVQIVAETEAAAGGKLSKAARETLRQFAPAS